MDGDFVPAGDEQSRGAARPMVVPLASANCGQVWTALANAQGKFETPKRTKEATIKGTSRSGANYEYKYKYAPLDEIERAIRPALAENGLMRHQYLVPVGDQWFIRTIIGHSSGEWIASDYPVTASDNRNPAQAFASGVTYARRYGLSLALGICPEDDDDAQGSAGQGDDIKPARPVRPRVRQAWSEPPSPASDLDEFAAGVGAQGSAQDEAAISKTAQGKAAVGMAALEAYWNTLTTNNKKLLLPEMPRLKDIAAAADAAARAAGENDDPFGLPPTSAEQEPSHAAAEPAIHSGDATVSVAGAPEDAKPAVTIVEPRKRPGKPVDWESTQKALVEAMLQMSSVAQCEAFIAANSATLHALKEAAPTLHEAFITVAYAHEASLRGGGDQSHV